MMEAAFDKVAFPFTHGWETPRFTNNPADLGGATKHGITLRTLRAWRLKQGQNRKTTKQDVKDLTLAEAKRIYESEYWEMAKCHLLPTALAIYLFDSGVNLGVRRAIKILQRVIGVKVDGVIGPKTLAKAEHSNRRDVLVGLHAQRIMWYSILKIWNTFKRGWVRRAGDCLIECSGYLEG